MFAPEAPSDSGSPFRSTIRWIFDPALPRSVGFGPASGPLLQPGGSRSRWHTGTSPARHGRRARPGRHSGASPRPGPGSTGRNVGPPCASTDRAPETTATPCSLTSPRTRSRPAPHGHPPAAGPHPARSPNDNAIRSAHLMIALRRGSMSAAESVASTATSSRPGAGRGRRQMTQGAARRPGTGLSSIPANASRTPSGNRSPPAGT